MVDLSRLQEATNEAQAARPKKRKPAKPIKPNDDVEAYYRRQMKSLVRAMARSVEQNVTPVLKRTKQEYTADAWSDDIETALQAAWAPFATAAMEATYRRLANDVVGRVAANTTASIVRSVNQSVGINLGPVFEAQPMRDYMNVAINENVSLIRSLPDEYYKRIRTIVYDGVAGKEAPTSIADQIQEGAGVSRRRAQTIASDQTGKITSQVTERRFDQAGIEYYQSIDAGDERVTGRPGGKYPDAKISCWGIARRDIGYGKGVYKMSEGASWGGETGLHPGRHHILCRCVSKPVFAWEVEESAS